MHILFNHNNKTVHLHHLVYKQRNLEHPEMKKHIHQNIGEGLEKLHLERSDNNVKATKKIKPISFKF